MTGVLSWLFSGAPFTRRSPLAQAEADAVRALNCQRVSKVRGLKVEATINGLAASVTDDDRERFRAALARAKAEADLTELLRSRGSA